MVDPDDAIPESVRGILAGDSIRRAHDKGRADRPEAPFLGTFLGTSDLQIGISCASDRGLGTGRSGPRSCVYCRRDKGSAGCFLLGALIALASCQAERVLAFASSPDASGNPGTGGTTSPGTGGATPSDGGRNMTGTQTDAGGGWTPFGTPQVVTGLRSASDDVKDPAMTFEQLEL